MANPTKTTVGTAIRTFIIASQSGDIVLLDNGPTNPPKSGDWIRASILWGTGAQVGTGAVNRYRHVGVLTFNIYTDAKRGTNSIEALMSKWEDLFTKKKLTDVGGMSITFRTPSSERVGRRGSNKWWQENVSCPFFYDTLK